MVGCAESRDTTSADRNSDSLPVGEASSFVRCRQSIPISTGQATPSFDLTKLEGSPTTSNRRRGDSGAGASPSFHAPFPGHCPRAADNSHITPHPHLSRGTLRATSFRRPRGARCARRPAPGRWPADNLADKVRPVPPPGIAVPDETAPSCRPASTQLGKEIDVTRASTSRASRAARPAARRADLPQRRPLRPDVQRVLRRQGDPPSPASSSQRGMERAKQLREGKAPWTTATGLVVRGYVSKIDGSVQPYGLVVPASYQADAAAPAPARRLVPRPRRER